MEMLSALDIFQAIDNFIIEQDIMYFVQNSTLKKGGLNETKNYNFDQFHSCIISDRVSYEEDY